MSVTGNEWQGVKTVKHWRRETPPCSCAGQHYFTLVRDDGQYMYHYFRNHSYVLIWFSRNIIIQYYYVDNRCAALFLFIRSHFSGFFNIEFKRTAIIWSYVLFDLIFLYVCFGGRDTFNIMSWIKKNSTYHNNLVIMNLCDLLQSQK